MRKIYITLAIVFAFLGIIFTILPMEKFGLIAATIATLFGFLAYRIADINQQKLPKRILIVSLFTMVIALGFILFTKDEVVAVDKQFEQKKVESAKEGKKDLEEEGL